MPTPPNERQSLEQELAELPKQIAAYRQELADTPALPEFKAVGRQKQGFCQRWAPPLQGLYGLVA